MPAKKTGAKPQSDTAPRTVAATFVIGSQARSKSTLARIHRERADHRDDPPPILRSSRH